MDGTIIALFYTLWDSTRPGRDWVEEHEVPAEEDVSEDHEVRLALRRLNRIGHLISQGELASDFCISLIGKPVIAFMDRVVPLIQAMRERREDPDFLGFTDDLLTRARASFPDYEPKPIEKKRSVGFM